MPNKTAWSDLPNAAHIDRILKHVKENPKSWTSAAVSNAVDAADAVRDAASAAVSDAVDAEGVAWAAASDALRDAVYDAAYDAVWDTVRNATLALAAWDDCGYLLDAEPHQVRMWAALGHQPAILLLSACVALHAQETTDA